VRWVSCSGEFAFLAFGGTAKGIIAIGGVAHGIVAIGAIASAGVISIGMNAVGSVAAVGLNAAAPISLSLINGLGLYSVAGVNGWGVWTHAGTNAAGISSHGGVNTSYSVLPGVVVILILIAASSVLRGKRAPRGKSGAIPLRRFVGSALTEARVRARLMAAPDGAVELADGGPPIVFRADASLAARARAVVEAAPTAVPVFARVAQVEERVVTEEEASYRERPAETKSVVLLCTAIEPAPEPESWLPKDASEIQWVIAWSARVAAMVSIALLVWLVAT
jgi:hypothetical protein